MVRENDTIVLIDFGLARSVDGAPNSTRTGVLRGSPYYMSPEQALGETLDGRTDLYSLGILFYEMVTGRKPYAGLSAIDVLQQHVTAPLPHCRTRTCTCRHCSKDSSPNRATIVSRVPHRPSRPIAGMRALRRTGSRL